MPVVPYGEEITTVDIPLSLTPIEAEDLYDYEATITRGLTTFYEVGNAFVAINQRKLYRAEYRTFEEYCDKKWGMSSRKAYRMIDAAEVVENLRPIGHVLETESQARELKGLEPDQQRQVMQKAIETAPGGKVTAQHIKDVRQVEIPIPEPEQEPVAAPVHLPPKRVGVFIPPNYTAKRFEPDDKPDEREDKAFHFMHQDRARICAAGLIVLRVDLYKRIIFSYDPQKGGVWKPRLKCKNDDEMIDAISRISEEPNTVFENRI